MLTNLMSEILIFSFTSNSFCLTIADDFTDNQKIYKIPLHLQNVPIILKANPATTFIRSETFPGILRK